MRYIIICLVLILSLDAKPTREHRLSDWDDVSELEHLETIRKQKARFDRKEETELSNKMDIIIFALFLFGIPLTLVYVFNTLRGTSISHIESENKELAREIKRTRLMIEESVRHSSIREKDVTPQRKYLC